MKKGRPEGRPKTVTDGEITQRQGLFVHAAHPLRLAGHIDLIHGAVVAQHLQDEQLFGQGFRPFHPQSHGLGRVGVQHHNIRFGAFCQCTDLVL